MTLELFGTPSCPYTAELREELDWKGREFVEYDVERDPDALRRMSALCQGAAAVPVLVEDGKLVQVGFRGRSCYVAAVSPPEPANE
jgi:glutaredoxin 3